MAGPWVDYEKDGEYAKRARWEEGDAIEFVCYDDEYCLHPLREMINFFYYTQRHSEVSRLLVFIETTNQEKQSVQCTTWNLHTILCGCCD